MLNSRVSSSLCLCHFFYSSQPTPRLQQISQNTYKWVSRCHDSKRTPPRRELRLFGNTFDRSLSATVAHSGSVPLLVVFSVCARVYMVTTLHGCFPVFVLSFAKCFLREAEVPLREGQWGKRCLSGQDNHRRLPEEGPLVLMRKKTMVLTGCELTPPVLMFAKMHQMNL